MSGINKNLLYEKFVDQIINFTNELIKLFPNDNQEFKIFKTGANLLRRTSGDKIVHKIFKESIEMYRHYIENRDEKFFLEHTYDEVELDESFDLNQIVKKLKGLWTELPETEKDKIWGYFSLLLKFSDRLSM
jgi:hypothetical protein